MDRSSLIGKVELFMQTRQFEIGNKRVIVACSGGPDSTACLYILHLLREKLGLSIMIAHVNYRLRGAESDRDEQYVRSLADRLNIPCHTKSIDLKTYCKKQKLSTQAAARQVRYVFFNKLALGQDADRIATGHNRDDNVETFLIHLLRGTGLQGLTGIRPIQGKIIRPLLSISNAEIIAFLNRYDIPYCIDSSNRQTAYLRNNIRHRLIPMLKEYNQSVVESICRTIDILEKEDRFLNSMADTTARSLLHKDNNDSKVTIDAEQVLKQPEALLWRLIRKGIMLVKGDADAIGHQHLKQIVSLLKNNGCDKITHLPGGIQVILADKQLIIENSGKSRIKKTLPSPSPLFQVAPPGAELDHFGIRLMMNIVQNSGPVNAGEAAFDCSRLSMPLTVRSWKPGDFFYPAGMGGKRKKIKKFFTDKKIKADKKAKIPLLLSGDDIIWIVGFRQDERYRADNTSDKILLVNISNLQISQ